MTTYCVSLKGEFVHLYKELLTLGRVDRVLIECYMSGPHVGCALRVIMGPKTCIQVVLSPVYQNEVRDRCHPKVGAFVALVSSWNANGIGCTIRGSSSRS